MKQEWPRITIVTPTFNRVEFLRECIESVLSQDYPNLEYIICDGGSRNPELLALLKEYEGRIAWWDSVPDRGHAEAIRRGFERSTGEIMAWLCSDDYYLPGAFYAVAEAFAANPALDIAYGHSRIVDASSSVIKLNRAIPYVELGAFTTCCMYQPASFWRRTAYERVGGKVGGPNWENVVYEPNVELFCRFQQARARFGRITVELVAMRIHDGAVNSTQLAKVKEVSAKTLRKFYPFYGHPLVYPLLHFVMRFYQIGALLTQGDVRFVQTEVIRRLSRILYKVGVSRRRSGSAHGR